MLRKKENNNYNLCTRIDFRSNYPNSDFNGNCLNSHEIIQLIEIELSFFEFLNFFKEISESIEKNQRFFFDIKGMKIDFGKLKLRNFIFENHKNNFIDLESKVNFSWMWFEGEKLAIIQENCREDVNNWLIDNGYGRNRLLEVIKGHCKYSTINYCSEVVLIAHWGKFLHFTDIPKIIANKEIGKKHISFSLYAKKKIQDKIRWNLLGANPPTKTQKFIPDSKEPLVMKYNNTLQLEKDPTSIIVFTKKEEPPSLLELIKKPLLNRSSSDNLPKQVYIVHYACSDFRKNPVEVTCLSILDANPQSNNTITFARTEYSEKDLLTKFFEFLSTRTQKHLVTWNWGDTTYGLQALIRRYKEISNIEFSEKIDVKDLDNLIEAKYNEEYRINDPKLINLAKLNGIQTLDFQEGNLELELLKKKEYRLIELSCNRKVKIIKKIYLKLLDNIILVNNNQELKKKEPFEELLALLKTHLNKSGSSTISKALDKILEKLKDDKVLIDEMNRYSSDLAILFDVVADYQALLSDNLWKKTRMFKKENDFQDHFYNYLAKGQYFSSEKVFRESKKGRGYIDFILKDSGIPIELKFIKDGLDLDIMKYIESKKCEVKQYAVNHDKNIGFLLIMDITSQNNVTEADKANYYDIHVVKGGKGIEDTKDLFPVGIISVFFLGGEKTEVSRITKYITESK